MRHVIPAYRMASSVKKSRKPELVSQAEYARRCGLSRQIIVRQITEGLIPVHGKKRRIDPNEADLRRTQLLDPVAGGDRTGHGDSDDAADPDFRRERARKEAALAGLRGLELRAKQGELVDIGKVNAWVAGMILRAKDIFGRIGDELGDRLANESDPIRCRELIGAEVRRGLFQMSEYKANA